MKNNEKALLQVLDLFKDDKNIYIPTQESPFIQGNYAVATNAYSLCYIDKEHIQQRFDEVSRKKIDAIRVIKDAKSYENIHSDKGFSISVESISSAIKAVSERFKADVEVNDNKCSCCDGRGEVEYYFDYEGENYYTDGTCPACNGKIAMRYWLNKKTGEERDYPPALLIEINGKTFSDKEVSKIAEAAKILNEEKIMLVHGNEEGFTQSYFKIGKYVNGIIMPIRTDKEYDFVEAVSL